MSRRLRVAVQSGNWSNPATWNGNTVPEARDIVCMNGYNVTLNQNATVYGLFNNIQQPINSYTPLTFNTLPEGKAESSDNSQFAWYAFTTSNLYRGVPGVSEQTPFWVSYEYPNQELILLKGYEFSGYNNNHPFNPTSWLFQAWDGTDWITLDDKTNYGGNYSVFVGELSSNTTAYYKYRFYVTQLYGGDNYITINLSNVKFWEDKSYRSASIDGGNLTINQSVDLSVTGLTIQAGNYDFILGTAPTQSIVNIVGSFKPSYGYNISSLRVNSGGATYNITGSLLGSPNYYSGQHGGQIFLNSPCTLNVIGNVKGGETNGGASSAIIVSTGAVNSTISIVGDVNSGGGFDSPGVYSTVGCTINITGSVAGASYPSLYGGPGVYSNNSATNLTIVGNVIGGTTTSYTYGKSAIQGFYNNLTVTGNVSGGNGDGNHGISSDSISLTIVGTLTAYNSCLAVYRSYYSYVSPRNNTFSGPFVCSSTGTMPFSVQNFKIIPSFNKYFQFRDNTQASSIYTLYSADTVVDNPIPANVRQGVSYGLGNFTGTLAVPSPNSVAFGIPTDNTTGLAVLTPQAIWNTQTSALTVAGSVGVRLKNVATIGMVGAQFEAFLKKD